MTGSGGQGVVRDEPAAGPDPSVPRAGHRLSRRRVAGLVIALVAVGAATAGIWLMQSLRVAEANRPNVPWAGALLGRDGRSLLISYLTGHCGDGPDRVVVEENPTTVTVGIVERPRSGGCAAVGIRTSIEAHLAEPLDGRQLLDADGRARRPVSGARILRPTYLPYRLPLTATSETPLPEADPLGWRLGYETAGRPQIAIQQIPAEAARFPDQAKRITTVSVSGHLATVTGRRTGLGAMYFLTWTAGGWTRELSVEAPPAPWPAVVSELVRTAESMR